MYRIGFLFLLLFSKASAQPVAIKWSEKLPTKGIVDLCGIASGDIFTAQAGGSEKLLLQRFDAALVLRKEDTLAFSTKRTEHLISFTSDSHLVHVMIEKEGRDQVDIVLLKNGLQHQQQTMSEVAAQLKDGYKGFVAAYYSKERSKLLITNYSFKAASQTTNRHFVVINTASGKALFTGKVSIGGSNESIGVANNGTVWLSSLQIFSWKNRLVEKPKTMHKIVLIRPGEIKNEFTVRFDTKYIPGVDFIQGDGADVYLAGIAYDNDTKATRLSGAELFMYTIDSQNGVVTDSAFTNFTGLYPERKLKEEDRLPYSIRQIYKRHDGGYSVLAEQYQVVLGQYNAATEKYNDIACIQLGANFIVESAVRIPKRQLGTDNPSFMSMVVADTAYLLYNDHADNLAADEDNLNYPSNQQHKNALFLVAIDKKGEYRKELLYDYASGEPMPLIRSGFLLNAGAILFPAEGQIGIFRIKNTVH